MSHNTSSYALSFFLNDTATTEIYTLSLHDALPISNLGGRTPLLHRRAARPSHPSRSIDNAQKLVGCYRRLRRAGCLPGDRKSTRLNSSHSSISYAVFCLKKKMNVYDQYVSLLARHV